MTFRVGLTGGICCGKSTVADLFHAHNIEVIDADQVARDVVAPNQAAFQQVVEHFGEEVLMDDGKLDRKKLRVLVFDSPTERRWLEQLLHPLIRERMIQLTNQATSPYIILMIPLLVENLPNPHIDRILVIDTSEAEQMSRTMQRDNLNREEAQKILISQVSRRERLKYADDVITNNGSVEELKFKVDKLHKLYLDMAQHGSQAQQ